jgi:hypothetical protein
VTNSELLEKLDRNARFYEADAQVFRQHADCRNIGPQECLAIADLLREAIGALREQVAA